MITIDNYEAYLLQYAEGTLSKEDCVAVEAFLKAHPDLKEEFEQFYDSDLKVTAPNVAMPNKKSMKHLLVMPIVWRSVAAACLVGVAVMLGIRLFAPQPETQMIAKMDGPIPQVSILVDTVVTEKEESPILEVKSESIISVEQKESLRIEECDEDTTDIATPIMAEEVETEEEIMEIITQIPAEDNQLIAMNEKTEPRIIQSDQLIKIVEEPKVVQCNDLIKIVEPMVVESEALIDVEMKPLKLVLEQYIATPLIVHAEKTRGKVVEQLFAMTDEFKNRYISNSNIPQL